MDWIEAAATIVQAIAVTAAGIAAVWGLTTWRHEMTARRRAELAEQTLAMFYEARDVIAWARTPTNLGGEGASRERKLSEADDEALLKNAIYVPIERINRRAEFWGRFEASRYAFMAVFGAEAANPYATVIHAKNRVMLSASMLVQTFDRHEPTRENLQSLQNEWNSNIGWRLTDSDEIRRQINNAVSAIEGICKPAITGGSSKMS